MSYINILLFLGVISNLYYLNQLNLIIKFNYQAQLSKNLIYCYNELK